MELVQAVYAFKGKNNDELRFEKGDVIAVTQRDSGGWWEGTLGDDTGWFPSNYVREYDTVREQRDRNAEFRSQVLDDIVESERAHVAELRNLVDHFLRPLEESATLAKEEYEQLTGNLSAVVAAHERLLERLGKEKERVGGLFLRCAPELEDVHKAYCTTHPRAVCVLDKHGDELNAFMEKCGAVRPGLLVLTAGLSKPFRRLQKYPAMLQELGRHVGETHPDRGDALRAVAVYKDIASVCAATRRQKELELQVVTGAVRGWQGTGGSKDLTCLGEVLYMGSVALGETHADRYFVLFPSTLLILSVSRRMSAFVYEGCLPLTGITVTKLEDTDLRKNCFEISGALIDTIVATCQSNAEAEKWVDLLRKHSSNRNALDEPGTMKTSPTDILCNQKQGVTTNHKRSHSFNNHQSYSQYVQRQQKQKDSWIQSSCDALLNQNCQMQSSRSTASSFAPILTSSFLSASHDGWGVKNLRPAPPLRPLAFTNATEADAAAANLQPYAPSPRKVNSYEEDGLILRVIEAYCTSSRSRNTVNSECEDLSLKNGNDWLVRSPSLPLHYSSERPSGLWPKIVSLETDVKCLKNELYRLKLELNEERHQRAVSVNNVSQTLYNAKE